MSVIEIFLAFFGSWLVFTAGFGLAVAIEKDEKRTWPIVRAAFGLAVTGLAFYHVINH